MPLAVLSHLGMNHTTAQNQFSLSGPPDLLQQLNQTMRKNNPKAAATVVENGLFRSPVPLFALLDWIEECGWTLQHFSGSGKDASSYRDTYIFRRNN